MWTVQAVIIITDLGEDGSKEEGGGEERIKIDARMEKG